MGDYAWFNGNAHKETHPVGPLDFELVGVIASLTQTLAEAGVNIFVVSTFDTDYLLVKEVDLNRAIQSLVNAGHSISTKERPTT